MFAQLLRIGHSIFAGTPPKSDAPSLNNAPLTPAPTSTFTPPADSPAQTQAPIVFRGPFRPDAVQLAHQVMTATTETGAPFDASAAASDLFARSQTELGNEDKVRQFFGQLLNLKETPVVVRLMTSELMGEVMQNRHQYPTLDAIADVIKKRHGEVSLGFFGKTKLFLALQPFLGKKDFFLKLAKLIATMTGHPEGVIALEILSFFFKTGHVSPAVKAILENFLKLLKVAF